MIGEDKRDEVIGHILRVTDQKMSYSEVESILDCYEDYQRSHPFTAYDVYEKDIGRIVFEDGRIYIDVTGNEGNYLYTFSPADIAKVFADAIRAHGSTKAFYDEKIKNRGLSDGE